MKRLLSGILVLAMLFSMVGTIVFAEPETVDPNNVFFDITPQLNNESGWGAAAIGIFKAPTTVIAEDDKIHKSSGNQMGADGGGWYIDVPAEGTPLEYTREGITYKLENYDEDKKNAFYVYGTDTTVDVPNKKYDKLGVLMITGSQVLFQVNYADGTSSADLENYNKADYKLSPDGWWNGPLSDNVVTFSGRSYKAGNGQSGNCCAYALQIPVDSTKVVDSITIVDNHSEFAAENGGSQMYRFFKILAMSGVAAATPPLTAPAINITSCPETVNNTDTVMSVSATVTPNIATGEYTIDGVTAKVDDGAAQNLTASGSTYSGDITLGTLTEGAHNLVITASYAGGETATATQAFTVVDGSTVVAENNVIFDLSAQIDNTNEFGTVSLCIFNDEGKENVDKLHKGVGNQTGADGLGSLIVTPPAETPLTYTRNGMTYQLANIDPTKKNAFFVHGMDAVVDVPNQKYERLGVLLMGGTEVLFKVNYADGTDSPQLAGYNEADYKLTPGDWWNGPTDVNNVVTFSDRILNGTLQNGTACAYALDIPVDSTKAVDSITVVDNLNASGNGMYRFFRILAMSGLKTESETPEAPGELTAPAINVTKYAESVYTTDALMEVNATVTPDTTAGEYTITGVTAKFGESGAETALTADGDNYSGYVNLGALAVGSSELIITATYGEGKTATENKAVTIAQEEAIANEKNIVFDISAQISSTAEHGARGVGIFNTKNTPLNSDIHSATNNNNGAEGGGSLIIVPQAGTPLTHTVNGISYKFANYRADRKNAFCVYDGDATVNVPNKNYDRLGVVLLNGQDTLFRVNYTDGTSSTDLAGYDEADYKFNTNGWWGWTYEERFHIDFPNRNLPDGTYQGGNCYACAFDIPVDSSKVVDSITVVDNLNASGNNMYRTFRVLAMSGIASENQSPEVPVTPDPLTPPTIDITSVPASVNTTDAIMAVTATVTPNTATGTYTITSVTAKIDGGAEQALTASGNTYSGNVNLGTLTAGSHNITVTATYGDGETATASKAFTVVEQSPGEDGGEIVPDNEKAVVVYTSNDYFANGVTGSSFSKSETNVDQNVWNGWHGVTGCKVYADGYVKFEPRFKEAGEYDVYYFVKGLPDEGDKSSLLEISVNGTVEINTFNSQAWTYDHWEKIGSYTFAAGKDAASTYVKVMATTSEETNPKEFKAFANAVAFVPKGEAWPRTGSVDTTLKRVGNKYFKQVDMSKAYNQDYFSGLNVHDGSDGSAWAFPQVTAAGVDLAANPSVVIEKSDDDAVPGLAEYPVPFQFGPMSRYALNTLKCTGNGNWKTAYVDVEPRKYDVIHVLFAGTAADQQYTLHYDDGSNDKVSMTPDHIDGYGSWFNSSKSEQAAVLFNNRIKPDQGDAETPVLTQNGAVAIYMSALRPDPNKVLTKIEPHGNGSISIFALTGEVSSFEEGEDLQLTDKETVDYVKGLIDFTMIKNENADADHVVTDLKLSTEGPSGTTISWSSSDSAIAPNGTVTPISFDENTLSLSRLYKEVVLTALITKGAATAEATVTVKVRPVTNIMFDLTEQLEKDGGIGIFNIEGNPAGEIHSGIGGVRGADGGGFCATTTPTTPLLYTRQGITYKLNNVSHEKRNAFFPVGDTEVDIPDGKYEKIGFIIMNGGDINFTINYDDGTSSEKITRNIGNWWTGYSTADNVVQFKTRIRPDGTVHDDGMYSTAFVVDIPTETTKTVKSITIDNNRGMRIMAISGIAADRQAAPTLPIVQVTDWPDRVGSWETSLPVAVKVTPNAAEGNNAVVGVTAKIDDSIITDDLSNDGGNAYSGSVTLSGLTPGAHMLVISATDAEGETEVYNYEFEVVNFAVDNIRFLNGSTEVASGVTGVNKVSVDVNNYTGASQNVKVVIASYKGNKLVDVVESDQNSVANGSTITVSKNINTTDADSIKIFTWDSLVNMNSIWSVEGR